MRTVYNIIRDYELITASVQIIKMYIDMSDKDIAGALNGLYINGYLDKVTDTLYKPSKYFADDSNLR